MKIILAGVTGYIGQEILSQCLAHPSITSIVALSRRELSINNEKLRVHIMKDQDFLSYSDRALIDELKGASACLWALGIRPSQAGDKENTRKICIEYTAAAAEAFQQVFTSASEYAANRFRFVYVSGAGVERDQNKSLWFWGDFRRLRGEAENVLLRHAQENSDTFEAYIMQPGLVTSARGTLRDFFWSLATSVQLDVLSRAMIDIALNGNKENTLSNQTIKEWGTR